MDSSTFENSNLSDATGDNGGVQSSIGYYLRAELPQPQAMNSNVRDQIEHGNKDVRRLPSEADYNEAVTDQHQAKLQADAGDWIKADTLYKNAVVAADKIDRTKISNELAEIRSQLKTRRTPESKKKLEREEQKLYLTYQAPVFTRTNYALACYRYGLVQEGDRLWYDAVKHDDLGDLKKYPEFLNQVKQYRNTVVEREEAVGNAISLLEHANTDFQKNSKMTPAVQQEYNQAINAAIAGDAKLDKTLLQTQLANTQVKLNSLKVNSSKTDSNSLQQIIIHDYSLLHIPAVAREFYARALDTSGDHSSAVQQRKIIANTDKQFYDDIVVKAGSKLEAIAGGNQLAKALDMLARNHGHLIPQARALFEQSRTLADAQLNKDKGQIEAKLKSDQEALTQLNQTKLAHYNQMLSEWKSNNPDGKNWNNISNQIANQKTELNKSGVTATQRESLQQRLNNLLKKRDALLPDYLKHLKTTLAPEFQESAKLEDSIRGLQTKLKLETRMSVMVRVYEAIALRQSGDSAQIKQANALLKEVVDKIGATPQNVTQIASEVLQVNGMNQAKPIFKTAIITADLARSQQQENAASQIASNPFAYASDPAGLGGEELLAMEASHPEQFTPLVSKDRVLADAPVQTRWLYAVSLFNSGEKKEAVQLLEQLQKQSHDAITIATLQVAKDKTISTITDTLIKSAVQDLQKNEGYIYNIAGLTDMLATAVATRYGAGPAAPYLGSAVGTAALTVMDYAIYGRAPSETQLALYAGFGLGIGWASGAAQTFATSQAARLLAPRTIAKADSVITRYAPESMQELSGLSGMPRIEATSGVLSSMYRAERGKVSILQYLLGKGSSKSYNDIVSARITIQRTNRLINALGFGAATTAPVAVIQGANAAATLFDGSTKK